MSELHLDSLEIKNFRCFEHLVIEKLGRVNLIVGKNSVGKTALLEALWLYCSDAPWPIVHKILYDRNELVIYNMPAQSVQSLQQEAIRGFIFNNNENGVIVQSFNAPQFFILPPSSDGVAIGRQKSLFQNVLTKKNYPNLPDQEYLEYDVIEQSKKTKIVFIPLKGLTWQATCTYWDDIALSDKEEPIISCLQLLDPLISRFTFKGENMKDRVRYSVVKTGRFSNPVPLAKMGEGIQRIFAIALAMTVATDGYLLIDEIETGLHHSIQADVWRAIFKLAHEWNVQVFATTHSWDCIEAFQEASAEMKDEEAMLIRLQRKRDGSGIEVVSYDERRREIATRQGIEVR